MIETFVRGTKCRSSEIKMQLVTECGKVYETKRRCSGNVCGDKWEQMQLDCSVHNRYSFGLTTLTTSARDLGELEKGDELPF
jgi:hypothetical protein